MAKLHPAICHGDEQAGFITFPSETFTERFINDIVECTDGYRVWIFDAFLRGKQNAAKR
jgi:hypothetical protein